MKYLFIFFLIAASSTYAQINAINWQKTIGGNMMDSPKIILNKEGDQGYYIISYSNSNVGFEKSENSFGGTDVWITYINGSGNVVWDKTYGGDQNDAPLDAILVNNKIYILCTSSSGITGNKTTSNFGSSDLWLLVLDLNGQINWQSNYGGSGTDGAGKIIFRNGFLYLFGNSDSPVSGNKTENSYGQLDYWIVKTDTISGTLLNQKTIGSSLGDMVIDASIDNNGTIYLLGASEYGISGLKTDMGYGDIDHWLVKLSTNFEILEQKCFGGLGSENMIFGGCELINDRLVIVGTTDSSNSGDIVEFGYGNSDAWVYCLDTMGLQLIWSKLYGGTNGDSGIKVLPFSGNNLVFLMNSYSGISGNKTTSTYGIDDTWLILADASGQQLYQANLGGAASDFGMDMLVKDNNVVVLNISESGISGVKTDFLRGAYDCWVLEINTSALLDVESIIKNSQVNVFPNPFSSTLNIQLSPEINSGELFIYSVEGKLLQHESIQGYMNQINLDSFSNGKYLLKIISENSLFQSVIIKN